MWGFLFKFERTISEYMYRKHVFYMKRTYTTCIDVGTYRFRVMYVSSCLAFPSFDVYSSKCINKDIHIVFHITQVFYIQFNGCSMCIQ